MFSESSSIAAAAISLTLVLVAAFFAVRTAISSRSQFTSGNSYNLISNPHRPYTLYEDEDGVASEESQAAVSSLKPRLVAVIGAFVPFTISIVVLVLGVLRVGTAQMVVEFLFGAGWILNLALAILLFRGAKFDVGVCAAVSSLALSFGIVVEGYLAVVSKQHRQEAVAMNYLSVIQVLFGVITAFACTSIQRRPEIYSDDKVVDAQYTCSALQRHTFSWARPILDKGRTELRLEAKDLPELDFSSRSSNLQARFKASSLNATKNLPLWYLLFNDHKRDFIRQWVVVTAESFALLAPQLCLFKLLSLLETRNGSDGGDVELEMWFWVASLAMSKLGFLFIETWLEWTNFAILATPVRSQLNILIFQKSMRSKDVKTGEKVAQDISTDVSCRGEDDLQETENSEIEPLLPQRNPEVEAPGEEEMPTDEIESSISRGTVNLLGVDVPRVSDFCGYNALLLGSLVKISLAVWFLVKLIGWRSTLSGLAVPLLFQPLNKIATEHYAAAQEGVMMARDEKTHIVTEALHGIRQIKFSGIEKQWQAIIMTARSHELALQRTVLIWATFMTFCWLTMPILLGAAALGTYAWLHGSLTASVAFTSLSVFASLEWTLSVVPVTITEFLDARVSISRIENFLNTDDKPESTMGADSVKFVNATISWPSNSESEDTFLLTNLNLEFPNEQLSAIHGKTGSGKSLMLAAIIGEADVHSGTVFAPKSPVLRNRYDHLANNENWILPDTTAFVAQIPWIENASFKDNILFGLPFNIGRYTAVLQACALTKDLEILPDGEDTEIGASGINLSGGQRWRVTFARALYSRAGVLILDDIFSAVDAHVGRHILEHALTGELSRGRTRILVTHHIDLVKPFASYSVELDDSGSVKSVASKEVAEIHHKQAPLENLSISSNETTTISGDPEDLPQEAFDIAKAIPKKFVEEEKREHGRVDMAVYKSYMNASGGQILWILIVALFLIAAGTVLGRSFWIKIWTQRDEDDRSSPGPHLQVHEDVGSDSGSNSSQLTYYLTIYIGLSLLASTMVCIKIAVVFLVSLRASRILFENMTYRVLRAPLRFLDTVPVGRLLNRFVSDFALIDMRVGSNFQWALTHFLAVLSIVAAALFVTFYAFIPVAVLATACFYYTTIYLDGARDIKRLESVSISPIFELMSSSLTGLATVRSFGKVEEYLERMCVRIDAYAVTTYHLLLMSRWMSFRQGFIGSAFAFCIASATVYVHGINASLAGFALSFALEYSDNAVNFITRYTQFELGMNSVERVMEYTNMPIEDEKGVEVSLEWPQSGAIVVKDLEVQYAPDLPSVLKGVNFSIKSCERIGIVGRTGSGKSSLTLTLFRFLEAKSGCISIDGQDISEVKLQDLRSRLAIIPQDPVLFSGTLRSNLDPFNDYKDSVIIDALRRVHLIDNWDHVVPSQGPLVEDVPQNNINTNIFQNLNANISRGGLNLSQGQRQLLCLARAIVRSPKIVVLDEATSAVDMATDELIQRSIREQFSDSTLLVIAHRLSTIVDFDKVLVMDDGQVVEFDTPQELMRKKGAFWKMLNDSGERERLEKVIG